MGGGRKTEQGIKLKGDMAEGSELPYTTWRTLNRLRGGVPKCKINMIEWRLLADNMLYKCGEAQSPAHLLGCQLPPETCTDNDFFLANHKAKKVALFWQFRV